MAVITLISSHIFTYGATFERLRAGFSVFMLRHYTAHSKKLCLHTQRLCLHANLVHFSLKLCFCSQIHCCLYKWPQFELLSSVQYAHVTSKGSFQNQTVTSVYCSYIHFMRDWLNKKGHIRIHAGLCLYMCTKCCHQPAQVLNKNTASAAGGNQRSERCCFTWKSDTRHSELWY